MSANTPLKYRLRAKLTGSKEAVNVLLFSKDGKALLSGGDDECVRVWDTEDFQCQQILRGSNWGQVTALTWIDIELPVIAQNTSICIGTGRGSVCICPMSKERKWFLWNAAVASSPFLFNDAVEAQAYDQMNLRLAVASHSGKIKLYSVERCVQLTVVWTSSIGDAIPRGLVFFGGANQSLLVHGLETGEMSCRDAQTSNVLWTKTLAGGVGNAVLSSDEATLLVDNLTSGTFDLYRFPSDTPSKSFPLKSKRRFTKQCVFAETGKVAVCGSDLGKMQVVDIATGKCIQLLGSETEHDLIQAVAASAVHDGGHLIAGGSSSGAPGIYLWEKKSQRAFEHSNSAAKAPAAPPATSIELALDRQSVINGCFMALIVVLSYPNWSPYFWHCLVWTSRALAHCAEALAKLSGDNTVEMATRADGIELVVGGAGATTAIEAVVTGTPAIAALSSTTKIHTMETVKAIGGACAANIPELLM